MKKHLLAILATGLMAAAASPAAMAAPSISVGAGASTLGLGANANVQMGQYFSATVGHAKFDVDGDDTTDGVLYEGTFESKNTTVTLNWHPFAGSFHIAAGMVMGDIEAAVTGTPRNGGTFDFNGKTYTAEEVGSLTGRVSLKDDKAPYVGIGWRSRGRIGMYFDLGVIAAETDVALQASGLAGDPIFQADLEAERRELADSADISLYPVIGAGVIFRF